MPGIGAFVIVVLALVASAFKVVREYERLVVFRLGRLVGPRGPGLTLVIPGIERRCAWTSAR
jgi:regulator of protease activity HflC (stomatin/prohibitin superfamily)